jgi:nucleotide-binding universal stress UspA family protein
MQLEEPYEPWPTMPHGFEETPQPHDVGEASSASRHDQEATEILRKIAPEVHARYVRLEGDIEETVMDYAVNHGASLVLIGTRSQKVRFLPALFYQTMQFMSDTRVPLMIVPHDYHYKPRQPLRILITDDLSENVGPVRVGVELTKLLGFCHLLHINVKDYADFALAIGGLSRIGIMSDGYFPYNDYDPMAQLTAEHEKIEHELKKRFESACRDSGISTDNFSYEAQFLIGDVSEEISRTAALFKADFVIFGGHDHGGIGLFHHKAMPDRVKLRQQRPILIAPIQKAG